MRPRHPSRWLMTDERQGEALWDAIARLPRGAGIVFRHYGLAPAARRRLFDAVRREARRRGLLLLLAGTPREAVGWRADGVHGLSPHRSAARALIRTAPCHDRRALVAARRLGVDWRFVSPVFPTRSHPGARALGPVRAGLTIAGGRERLVALGGMSFSRFRRISVLGFAGWAAIDAWSSNAR